MATRQISKINAELNRFLKKYPKTDVMELLIADITGVLRCKRIRKSDFRKIFKDGFTLPGGTVLIDTIGDAINGIPWSSDDGDPDTNASVVPGSIAPVPWAQKPSAQALFRFSARDGKPFFADPRYVL